MSFDQNIKGIDVSKIAPEKKGLIKILEIAWEWIYDKSRLYILVERVPKVIGWIPVIWRTRDWDETGIWEVLAHKLKNHAKVIENGYHIEDKKIAEEIRKIEAACRRLIENDYCREEHDAHYKKWPFKGLQFYPQSKKDKKLRLHRMKFSRGASAKDSERIWKLEEERRKSDLRLVANALRKKSGSWWC